MASASSPLIRPHPHHVQSYDSIVTPSAIADEELTEEELAEYERGIISWRRATRYDFWFRREWFWGYIISIVLIILVTLMTVFHHQVSTTGFLGWMLRFVYCEADETDYRLVDAVCARVAKTQAWLAHTHRPDLSPEFPSTFRKWQVSLSIFCPVLTL